MPFSLRTAWPLVVPGLLAAAIVAASIGAQLLEPRQAPARAAQDPPPPVTAFAASATMTPTPRVIAIPGTTSPPAPAPATTATSLPAVEVMPSVTTTRALLQAATPAPTPTPWVLAADAPPPTPLPTAVALPTVLVSSSAATSQPPPSPASTPTPEAMPAAAPLHTFAAEDWGGGFYRGDGQAYGRPWVAVYGAYSAYPRAALAFTLDTAPSGPATLTVTGLDDEWEARNEIVLEINGEAIFAGAAPFANWDGVGDGADAAWTTAAFTIPGGVLHAGANEIAIANLTPSGNFNAPPYILLAETALALGEPDPVPTISPSRGARIQPGDNGQSRQSRGQTARQDGKDQRAKAPNNEKKAKKPKERKHQNKKPKGKKGPKT